jgi:hypothetical protein
VTSATVKSFAVGSLVAARGREWVVQAGSTDDLLLLRPIAGADDEITGILPALEAVTTATFDPPTLDDLGPAAEVRLIRDAFRIGSVDTAGPFRGMGRIAVRPRPYQLVPLLMAMRLVGAPEQDAHPSVRMLISDDVGIGKTIEAALIANELLTTGEADGLAVVCPPHLSDQWVQELRERFHFDAVKVGPSTVHRLERGLPVGESLFSRHRITVVSLDWVKSKRRRDEFAQSAPNLVIVDEAHLCSKDEGNSNRNLRHDLLRRLAADPDRHIVLVSAIPHSGKEGAFRSLIGLLHPRLDGLTSDTDLTAEDRERLARHFVARRRVDVLAYGGQEAFPTRETHPGTDGRWRPSDELRAVITEVMAWARPRLEQAQASGDKRRQRVWWWSMLALARSLTSSPRAGAATLRKRAGTAELAEDADEDDVDSLGRSQVGDDEQETSEADDVEAGARVEDDDAEFFRSIADRVERLAGPKVDKKLDLAVNVVKGLLKDDYSPIVFCRFIGTAEYVAEHLRDVLRGVEVAAVTGTTPGEVRAEDVARLGTFEKRVLVATDCLSEGINLQDRFDAVIHYDLPWNPTRLEQREGRVDRYGQRRRTVRIATLVGENPTIDPLINRHLIEKHLRIKQSLGFSIAVPGITNDIIDAAATEWLYGGAEQVALALDGLEQRWVVETEREVEWIEDDGGRRSQSKYSQRTIDPSEVAELVEAIDVAVGSPEELGRFVGRAIRALGGSVTGDPAAAGRADGPEGGVVLGLTGLPGDVHADLALALGHRARDLSDLTVRFDDPPPLVYGDRLAMVLPRTHPFIAELGRAITDPALDRHVAIADKPARRLNVMASARVDTRTWLVTARFRYDLDVRRRVRKGREFHSESGVFLIEDVATVAIRGRELLDAEATAELLDLEPEGNLSDGDRQRNAQDTLARLAQDWPALLSQAGERRAEDLQSQRDRVRRAVARGRGQGRSEVRAHASVDVLAVSCVVPIAGA